MTAVNDRGNDQGFVQTHPYVYPFRRSASGWLRSRLKKSRSEIVREALDEWFDKHAQ